MEKSEILKSPSPLHLVRCMGELAVMYAQEKTSQLNDFMDNAMDVWGEE